MVQIQAIFDWLGTLISHSVLQLVYSRGRLGVADLVK